MKKWVIAVIAAAAVIVVGAAGLALYVSGISTVYPNVLAAGVPVGGMTFNEAYSAIDSSLDLDSKGSVTVTVKLTDAVDLELDSVDVGFGVDANYLANLAVNYGKEGGFFSRIFTFLRCLGGNVEAAATFDAEAGGDFDEEAVRAMISDAAEKASYEAASRQCTITDTDITIVKGGASYTVDEQGIYDYVYDIFHTYGSGHFETDQFSQDMTETDGGDGEFDFDALYNEVCKEPVNAYYDKTTKQVVEGVTGVSFDLEAAKAEYEKLNTGEKMVIELKITEPEMTAETVSQLLFRDKLAEKSTSLSTSSSNRITNVTLSAEACNVVLEPGEEFSFNGIVGQRTAEKGYKAAGAYVGGETVDQIGGGICQTSSTIYYCALMADLEITDRRNHMYPVAYLPMGLDATVDWGNIDFKFKNNTEYPIKIVAKVEDKNLYVEIWGTKLDENYTKLTYKVIETIPRNVVEQEDESIPEGETKVKTAGHDGYVVRNYQNIYDKDGKLIESNDLGLSRYRTQDRVVLVPVKKEEEPKPEEGETTEEGEEKPGEGEGTVTPPETGEGESTVTPPETGDGESAVTPPATGDGVGTGADTGTGTVQQ